MAVAQLLPIRQTSADLVFEQLYAQIMSLELLPGTRMSEAEVAERFGISRQPVRDAFNRLGNIGLLDIKPQRATLVQTFSMKEISKARFVRLAVELEVVREAVRLWRDDYRTAFEANLAQQSAPNANVGQDTFHALDDQFHSLIADVAQKPFALQLIRENKAQVDRICVLSLKQEQEKEDLIADHQRLYQALSMRDLELAETTLRLHLSRIEKALDRVQAEHANYFRA